MKLSDYVILGKPLYVDREFNSEKEEREVFVAAMTNGRKMQAQGFYLLDFQFRDGRLKIRLGEEPVVRGVLEKQG